MPLNPLTLQSYLDSSSVHRPLRNATSHAQAKFWSKLFELQGPSSRSYLGRKVKVIPLLLSLFIQGHGCYSDAQRDSADQVTRGEMENTIRERYETPNRLANSC